MRFNQRNTSLPPLSYGEKDKQPLWEFFEEFGLRIAPTRVHNWRMTLPTAAGLRGFPHLSPVTIRATDGVHAFVECHGGEEVLHCHLTNFQGEVRPQGWRPPIYVPVERLKADARAKRKPKAPRSKPLKEELKDLSILRNALNGILNQQPRQ